MPFRKSAAHGPLEPGWMEELASRKQKGTYVCVYKLIQFNFKWFGLQTKTEDIIMKYVGTFAITLANV